MVYTQGVECSVAWLQQGGQLLLPQRCTLRRRQRHASKILQDHGPPSIVVQATITCRNNHALQRFKPTVRLYFGIKLLLVDHCLSAHFLSFEDYMTGKEPFGKDSLDPGRRKCGEQSDAGSNQAGYRRWANM